MSETSTHDAILDLFVLEHVMCTASVGNLLFIVPPLASGTVTLRFSCSGSPFVGGSPNRDCCVGFVDTSKDKTHNSRSSFALASLHVPSRPSVFRRIGLVDERARNAVLLR